MQDISVYNLDDCVTWTRAHWKRRKRLPGKKNNQTGWVRGVTKRNSDKISRLKTTPVEELSIVSPELERFKGV